MIPAERQQYIRSAIEVRGVAGFTDMAASLGVSHMTIRRDMRELERQGYVTLISGGAQKAGRIREELSQKEKRRFRHAEKAALAQKAVALIRPGAAVYFDAGTTCLAIAEAAARCDELRDSIIAVTNDFTVAAHLMEHTACRLFHTGGEVLRDNKSCAGETTANVIRGLNLDIAFLSASSWDDEWISTPTESKIAVKTAAARSARSAYLVSDSSKYGKLGFFNVLKLRELDGIITDTGLPQATRAHFTRSGTPLMLAERVDTANPALFKQT